MRMSVNTQHLSFSQLARSVACGLCLCFVSVWHDQFQLICVLNDDKHKLSGVYAQGRNTYGSPAHHKTGADGDGGALLGLNDAFHVRDLRRQYTDTVGWCAMCRCVLCAMYTRVRTLREIW